MSDVFYLDTDEGSVVCHVMTTLYSEVYKHHYLVYEMESVKDEIFVSIFNREDGINELLDVEGKELEYVIAMLESDGDML